ncbi:MAG TPA: periplasmic heavy metal sensor [Opitutales bacterium]|nr:periplasmic heavy metal sensor [Opitutales bacterium]
MVNEHSKTKPILLLLTLVVLSCALSYAIAQWTSRSDKWQHDKDHGHEWLREEIGLNDEEFSAISQFEADYRKQRNKLLRAFDGEMKNLQSLLLEKDEFSPELQTAIHDLHVVHGQLQELSIRHYFDMLGALPPDKRDRLREVAAKALSQPE